MVDSTQPTNNSYLEDDLHLPFTKPSKQPTPREDGAVLAENGDTLAIQTKDITNSIDPEVVNDLNDLNQEETQNGRREWEVEKHNNGPQKKIDVKPRGKIPIYHQEVFRKNFLSIMENIRVDDITDHLFSKKVIDSNEMDKVMSILRSEGNRDALRYLMYTLFNSSHIALPTFMQCLQQTGYYQLAGSLQDEMDKQSNRISTPLSDELK
ncbi:hypothetical protein LOTGIDRAFT_163389 [Lottia gigantea]|uniref:CARD domain-containing protein n=1 Tax=Lottia gigantea TaxID=225164 RepID=V4A9A4_LOTGI|nr:hypothetical protein LOTGIDRAFT_163389 [Lottia gigantea]ESO91660.1 hypothetical protein LOTGIDRAFT_163389 [Lottia gigantea]